MKYISRILSHGMQNHRRSPNVDNGPIFNHPPLIVGENGIHHKSPCVAWSIPECINRLAIFSDFYIDNAM